MLYVKGKIPRCLQKVSKFFMQLCALMKGGCDGVFAKLEILLDLVQYLKKVLNSLQQLTLTLTV